LPRIARVSLILIFPVLTSSGFANALPFTGTSVLSLTATAAWPCALPSDLNCDCVVNTTDIMLVASIWHTAVGDPEFNPDYDVDDDGYITIVDIMLVAVHWGETCLPEGGALVWAIGNTRKVLPTDSMEENSYVWSGADRSVMRPSG
jgi:hypothetical protein